MQPSIPGFLRGKKELLWKDQHVCYNEVEKGGLANLNDLYMWMHQWFQKEQLTHWAEGSRYEDFYLHRIRGDGVQENLIWWRALRKINPYIYYFIKMDWQVFGAKETEVLYNDKKVKAHKLGIVIRMWWWVQIDPFNKWETSFLNRIAEWLYRYLLNTEMEDHRDKCREIARRLDNELKAFFEMTTSMPMPRSWFPEEGYKWVKQKPEPERFTNLPRKPDWQI